MICSEEKAQEVAPQGVLDKDWGEFYLGRQLWEEEEPPAVERSRTQWWAAGDPEEVCSVCPQLP